MADKKAKYLEAAARFLEKGRPEKAMQEYQHLLDEDPNDPDGLRLLGELLVRQGQPSDAVPFLFRLGAVLARAGAQLKSAAAFKTVLKIDPECVDAYRYLVDIHLKLGMTAEASEFLLALAELSEKLGVTKDHLAIYRKLVELDPKNIAHRLRLAELCSAQGQLDEAVQAFRQAAKALQEQGRLQEYLKVAERLLRHVPSDTGLAKELANIYVQMGDTRSALQKLQLAHKHEPTDTETLLMLANLFAQLQQPAKAVHILKVMAHVHMQEGSVDGAQQAYRRVLQISPDDPDALKFFGG
ncbi:MAG TPA: tetratricopeptide repeat protein [Myxococcota bacterium]|nr:tetratricopeptide repeat protein [Myxococcota bacterium]HRY95846.1 tetratricopeptide repeat protein [Myxococcota bacterium]HSA24338.1 tetratricopeptide repeat protein [Myxococcota bacterium]